MFAAAKKTAQVFHDGEREAFRCWRLDITSSCDPLALRKLTPLLAAFALILIANGCGSGTSGSTGAGGSAGGSAGGAGGHGGAEAGTGGSSVDGSGASGGGTNPGSVEVKGLADIWLAGQPDGTILAAGWPRDDVAPANSPVSVPVAAGSTLSILATGGTSNVTTPCAGANPDGCGIADLSGYAHGPANALSSLVVPANALVGVFVGAGVPSGTTPTGLVMLAPNAFAILSPLMQQTFFIGDGLTGTGSGAVQQFVVPAGATQLFLGSSDAEAANYDNFGEFMVTVSTLATGGGGASGP